jgi:DNA-binding CsgD family transcriptional regulator
MPRPLKVVLPVCFLIIWGVFAREIFVRLFAETTVSRFVLSAPFSGYLVFICMFGALLYAWIALVVTGAFSFLGSDWHTGVTSMVLAAVNIPGLLYLRRCFAIQSHAAAAQVAGVDLSLLEDRYGITPREREIISLVITGRSNREITDELFISPETVKKHIYNAYRKIGVRNRVQLVNTILDFTSDGS